MRPFRDLTLRAASITWLVLLTSSATCAAEPDPPTLGIPLCTRSPIVDGLLADPCWEGATTIRNLHVVGTDTRTGDHKVLVTADRKWLYVAFNVALPADRNPITFTTHDSKVHREDHVLVAYGPGAEPQTFYAFWLNREGVRAESRFSAEKGWEIFWDIPWRGAAVQTGTGYTAEIALPWCLLGATGDPAKATLNVIVNSVVPVRDQHHVKASDRHEIASWAPVARSFREPERFGSIMGLAEMSVDAPFLPHLSGATVTGYRITDGGYSYALAVDLRNFTSVPGAVEIQVIDQPEKGPIHQVCQHVTLTAAERKTAEILVPVTRPGARTVSVRVLESSSGAVLQEDLVDTSTALDVFSAYLDRNYYTAERDAVAVCHVRLPPGRGHGLVLRAFGRGKGCLIEQRTTGGTTRLRIPLTHFPPGTHTLRLDLGAPDGPAMASEMLELVRHTPKPGAEWKIDRINRVLLENEVPFFPFGIIANVPSEEACFETLAAAGFNCVSQWHKHTTLEEFVRGLELAQKHGLKVMPSPDICYTRWNEAVRIEDPGKILSPENLVLLNARMKSGGATLATGIKGVLLQPPFRDLSKARKTELYLEYFHNNRDRLTEAITAATGYSHLMGHFILDEPLLQLGADVVGQAFYRMINELDGYHPVFVNYSSSIPDTIEALNWSDALGTDPYWIPAARGKGGRNTINFVPRTVAITKERADRVRSVTWSVLMAEYWSGCNRRILQPQEQKCQTYLALIHGAKGILYYSYPLYSRSIFDTLSELSQQVGVLGPACLQPTVKQEVQYTPGTLDPLKNVFTDVQVAFKRSPAGGYILLAANAARYPVDTTFSLPDFKGPASIERLFAKASCAVSDRSFVDRIEAFGVRAYGIPDGAVPEPVRLTVTMAPRKDLAVGEVPGFTREGRVKLRNILPNPSYEEVSVEGWPDYHKKVWGLTHSPAGFIGGPEANWGISKDRPWHGANCLFLKTAGGPDQVIAYTDVAIKVTEPQEYTFSAFLRADRDDVTVDLNMGPYSHRKDKSVKVGQTWGRHMLSVALPKGYFYTMALVILRRNEAPARVWIDAAQLEAGSDPTEFQP